MPPPNKGVDKFDEIFCLVQGLQSVTKIGAWISWGIHPCNL